MPVHAADSLLNLQIDVDTHLTGAEFLHRIRRCAAGFSREGLKRGARVCCQLGNTLDGIVAAMGVVFAGGTLVMAKTTFVESECAYFTKHVHIAVTKRFPTN